MISIIYVDDKPDLLLLGRKILQEMGDFSVQTCATVEEGLHYLKGHTCDAVVSCHRVGVNGIAFLEQARKQSGDIPVILLISPDDEEALPEVHRNHGIIFPWNEEEAEIRFPELARTIREVVQRKQSENTANDLKSEIEVLKHRAAMLGILNEIISLVNNAESLSDLLENILERTISLLNFDAGGIYFVDSDSRTAHIVHSQNLPSQFIAEVDHVSIDTEPYNTMFIRNQPLFIENYALVSPQRSQKYGLCSIATLPLISKNTAIGVLNVASMRRYLINDEEKQTLISISRELGSAIERLRAEEEREQSAQNIRTLFHSIDEIVFVIDLKGKIIAMNTTAEQKLSYSQQELIGRSILDILAPEKREDAVRLFEKLVDGTAKDNSIPIIAKDGTRIEADTKVSKGRWDDQDVLIGVSRDVTDRRRFEEALQKSEHRLNEAQHIAKIGSWELDIPSNRLIWSDVIFEIFEIDPIQFGASYEAFLNAIHPDDRKSVDEAYSASVKNHTPYQVEHRLLMPDGRVKFVLEQCETKYDPLGNPLSSLGTVQDITEYKLAEISLKEKDLRYREIFEGNFDGYVMVDRQGHVIDANQAYCNLVEYSLEELQKLDSFYDITAEKYRKWEDEEIWNKRLLIHGYSGVFEKEYIRKNGEVFPVELQAYASYGIDGNLNYLWAVVRDITKRKQAEEERERLITTIKKSNEELNTTYDNYYRHNRNRKIRMKH